jgi:hypothetical protein
MKFQVLQPSNGVRLTPLVSAPAGITVPGSAPVTSAPVTSAPVASTAPSTNTRSLVGVRRMRTSVSTLRNAQDPDSDPSRTLSDKKVSY